MEKVEGIGGVFFRAEDPETLARWYSEHLGVDNGLDEGASTWQQEAGPTILAPFSRDTEYFGRREQQFMVNFRVCDLDAMLSQLRAGGVEVISEEEEEGAGRFAFIEDPEGNRVQLWEPRLGESGEPNAGT